MGRLSLAALALCGAWTISSTGAAQEDWPEEEAWPELEPQAQQPATPAQGAPGQQPATPAQGTPGQQPYPASYGQPAAAQTPAEPPPPSLLETSTHLFDLMAVFGFPVATETAERQAVAAAVEMRQAVHDVRDELGLDAGFDVKIGANTGPILAVPGDVVAN